MLARSKKCGWFCRNWKKVAGAAAAIVGGPVGVILGAIINTIPNKPQTGDKSLSNGIEFSPRVEQLLNAWAKNSFDTWYVNKLRIFKGKPTLASLTSSVILSQVNRVLLEIASYVKYYEYMTTQKGVDTELYSAKAIVMQDALTEFSEVYNETIKSLHGVVYIHRVDVRTMTVIGGPDKMNWNGKSFMIKIPSFSSKPNTISTKPVSGGLLDLTLPPDIIRPNAPILPPVHDGQLVDKDVPVNCLQPPCPQTKPSVQTKPIATTKPMVVHQTITSDDSDEQPKKKTNNLIKVAATVGITMLAINSIT